MPYKDYDIINTLKPGGTSQIFKVKDKDTGEQRVLKLTSFNQIQKSIWLNEVKMLEKFQYVRGIVKMFEFGEITDANNEEFGYVILELCDDDLFENPIQFLEIKKIFYFLYQTLSIIHSMGYCYCDLKPENILRQGIGFRLCDFSSCQPIGTITNVLYGTLHVMAPELYQSSIEKKEYYYDEKIDTWGLGCLLFELITKTTFDRNIPITNENFSIDLLPYKNIIELCLKFNPQDRPRIWELSGKIKDLKILNNNNNNNNETSIDFNFVSPVHQKTTIQNQNPNQDLSITHHPKSENYDAQKIFSQGISQISQNSLQLSNSYTYPPSSLFPQVLPRLSKRVHLMKKVAKLDPILKPDRQLFLQKKKKKDEEEEEEEAEGSELKQKPVKIFVPFQQPFSHPRPRPFLSSLRPLKARK
jgi:serine/threonine protein kinase